jgi:hypothetical protein
METFHHDFVILGMKNIIKKIYIKVKIQNFNFLRQF